MISQSLISTISACAREFDARAIWLFGSALEDESTARDIDVAVEGLAPEKFFPFWARLDMAVAKSIDLVDLSLNPPIAHIIRARGIRVHEG